MAVSDCWFDFWGEGPSPTVLYVDLASLLTSIAPHFNLFLASLFASIQRLLGRDFRAMVWKPRFTEPCL